LTIVLINNVDYKHARKSVYVNLFQQYMPIIKIMCNPALTERHWEEMSEITGFDLTPNAGTTLTKMIDLHLEELLPQ